MRLQWMGLFILLVGAAAPGQAVAAEVSSGTAVKDASGSTVREGPAMLDPRGQGIGRLVADVEVTDLDGKPVRLSSFRGRPLVVCVTSPDCPVARKYLPVLAAVEKEFGPL